MPETRSSSRRKGHNGHVNNVRLLPSPKRDSKHDETSPKSERRARTSTAKPMGKSVSSSPLGAPRAPPLWTSDQDAKMKTSNSGRKSRTSPAMPGAENVLSADHRASRKASRKTGSQPLLTSPGARNESSSDQDIKRNKSHKSARGARTSAAAHSPGTEYVSSSDRRATRNISKQQAATLPLLVSPGNSRVSKSDQDVTTRKSSKSQRRSRTSAAIPGVENVSTFDHRASRKASRQSHNADRAIGPEQSINGPPLSTAHGVNVATTLPDVEALEAARQQGREEERNARNEEEVQIRVLAALTAANKKQKNERVLMLIAFVLVLIAGGIAAWQLLSGDASGPIEDIDSGTFIEVQTSSFPSMSPSANELSTGDDTLSSLTTCQAIENGIPVLGQETVGFQEYDILMDVMLDSEAEDLTMETMELEEKIRRLILPSLAACTKLRRRLQIESYIVNALVDAELGIDGACLSKSERPCYRYVIHLGIYLQSIVSSFDFSQDIMAEFRAAPLVERLGLLAPFKNITLVEIISNADSEIPSAHPSTVAPTESPSENPTRAPVTFPTTEDPTTSPSKTPTKTPTTQPTTIPTQSPTKSPTPNPTQQPVVAPTLEPTPGPTPSPTVAPSVLKSDDPTSKPSLSLSNEPTMLPSTQPSTSPPTSQPSLSPTLQCFQSNTELQDVVSAWFQILDDDFAESSIELQYGPIESWCFGASVTSMERLFDGRYYFNEDLSNWDVSSVTNMKRMFHGAASFNQDLSAWDVSSVTNMESMFSSASSFNGDISSWNVSSVTSTYAMFEFAVAFNQDLSIWDVSSATNMAQMFFSASSFNQDLSAWVVSSVTTMEEMFDGARSFNQNLCPWGSRIPEQFNDDDDTYFVDAGVHLSVGLMFGATNCPSPNEPILTSNQRGPFCHECI